MSEWWTYRPADFLMFAPDTYWRLVELHNLAWWPLGLLAQLLSLALLLALWRNHPSVPRWGGALMAVLSAAVAWGFVWRLYVPINWGAQPLAALLALIALGWTLLLPSATPPVRTHMTGVWLLCAATVLWPCLAPATGRPVGQMELIGLAPDPTVVAGLGLLLNVRAHALAPRLLWWFLWGTGFFCLLASAATLATMESAQAAAPLVAAGVALWGASRRPERR